MDWTATKQRQAPEGRVVEIRLDTGGTRRARLVVVRDGLSDREPGTDAALGMYYMDISGCTIPTRRVLEWREVTGE